MKIINIKDISSLDNINPEIIDRIKNGSRCSLTKQYVVFVDKISVANAAIDFYPVEKGYLVLYELFVSSNNRRQGIGSKILLKIEKIAKSNKYKKIIIRPKSLNKNIPEENLKKWYEKRGYQISKVDSSCMEKIIS
ncbi:MAG TPA: hypothetical protein DCX95_02640 [Elusimicrobia bacterium]|nr:hypothetical protein [Elusimicrobiota bacterium]